MRKAASRKVAESLLRGFFDVANALFSVSFERAERMFTPNDLAEVDPDTVRTWLMDYPVAFRARLKRKGAIAFFFTEEDAARFVSLTLGEDPDARTQLSDDDLATAQEVASSALGGGVSNVMETFGQPPEQLTGVAVARGVDAEKPVMDLFGPGGAGAEFRFASPPAFGGRGVVLFSREIVDMAPKDIGDEEDGVNQLASNAHLTEEEMSDILSGFSPEGVDEEPLPMAPPAAHAAPPPVAMPSNIDMVLDIKLVVTARLGRVEMPIGEIMALGPGSIISVGHLVDEPVELLVNDKLIARGDVVVVDEKFGLRITELVSTQQRIESLR